MHGPIVLSFGISNRDIEGETHRKPSEPSSLRKLKNPEKELEVSENQKPILTFLNPIYKSWVKS